MVVYAMGSNDSGQLGFFNPNVKNPKKNAVEVDMEKHYENPTANEFFRGKGIISLAAGDACSAAISITGNLYSFGNNRTGKLGL